jgi:NAD(P)H dehydrogenase (quinone)
MRIFYLYCHPAPESFHGSLRTVALAGLARAGHAVDLCDLYAESFDPVLGAAGWRNYHDLAVNQRGLENHVDRLGRAEALVVQFPTWCYGAPAMLKGFLDRLLLPGVAFDLTDRPGSSRCCTISAVSPRSSLTAARAPPPGTWATRRAS